MQITDWKIYGGRTIGRLLHPVELPWLLERSFALGEGDMLCVHHKGETLDVMTRGTERTGSGLHWVENLLKKGTPPSVVFIVANPFKISIDLAGTDLNGDNCYCEVSALLSLNPQRIKELLDILREVPVLSTYDLIEKVRERVSSAFSRSLTGGALYSTGGEGAELKRAIVEELHPYGVFVSEVSLNWADEKNFEAHESSAQKRSIEQWKFNTARPFPDLRRLYEMHSARVELLTEYVVARLRLDEQLYDIGEEKRKVESDISALSRMKEALAEAIEKLSEQADSLAGREKQMVLDNKANAERWNSYGQDEIIHKNRTESFSNKEAALDKKRNQLLGELKELESYEAPEVEINAVKEKLAKADDENLALMRERDELAKEGERLPAKLEELKAEAKRLEEESRAIDERRRYVDAEEVAIKDKEARLLKRHETFDAEHARISEEYERVKADKAKREIFDIRIPLYATLEAKALEKGAPPLEKLEIALAKLGQRTPGLKNKLLEVKETIQTKLSEGPPEWTPRIARQKEQLAESEDFLENDESWSDEVYDNFYSKGSGVNRKDDLPSKHSADFEASSKNVDGHLALDDGVRKESSNRCKRCFQPKRPGDKVCSGCGREYD
ncbi:MAG: hypothetical protein C0609_05195 [Deltaproteobacteria bacterium]|nr:MAG: hypothetical protein C0609_05195 [Deltaproteobacteria bacterium]